MSTWRHTCYGQCLIIVTLVATSAYGQWDANAWPAKDHPRAGKIHAMNCYSAIVERCHAVNITIPSSPVFYRSQRGNISTFKTKFKQIIPLFCDSRYITNGVITSWLNSKTNYPQYLNTGFSYSVVSFCEMSNLPTNFFDYTPYRGLDGIGPFTNDSTVGNAHGWTNEYTVKGGDFFPPGRSTWYTTDYGWDMLKNALSNLQYTLHFGSVGNRTIIARHGYGATYDNWAENITEAESNFNATTYGGAQPIAVYSRKNNVNEYHECSLDAAWFITTNQYANCRTNVTPSSVMQYILTTGIINDSTNLVELFPQNYDPFDTGYDRKGAWWDTVSANWNWWPNLGCPYGWQEISNSTRIVYQNKWQWTLEAGTTNMPGWADDADFGASKNRGFTMGYAGSEIGILLDFSGTSSNGFQYK